MAKKVREPRKPGRIRQMWQVFQMTQKFDSNTVWWLLLAFIGPIAISVLLAFFVSGGSVLTFILWILIGVLTGVLLGMIVLGRLAERAAYSQIEGQPGAVGAILRSSLRRGWASSEMPVAVNPKTQDAIYRAVGRGGVVLVAEGPKTRTTKMVVEETRKVARVVPNVPVTVLTVGPDDESVPLRKVTRSIARVKPTLTKAEVRAIANRLASLDAGFGIPKGIDPTKIRPDHKAVRGR